MKNKIAKNITSQMFLSAFKTTIVFQLANMGASFIDGLVTSHYFGSTDMAVVGLCSPFFTFTSALCTCIGTGLVALCANNFGKGDKKLLNSYFNSALCAMLLISLVLEAMFLIGAEPIARLLGARGSGSDLVTGAASYMRGLAIGLPTFLISGVTAQAIQMDGGGKHVKFSALGCLVIDAVFDVLAVWLGWGLFGIGLATSISTVVKMVILFSHFFGKNRGTICLKFSLPKIREVFEMIHSGSDTLLLSAANLIKPVFLNSLILSVGGSITLSIMSIYNNLNGLIAIIGVSVDAALAITVGIMYGETNRIDILRIARFAQKLIVVLEAPIILILIAFSNPITQYYLPNLKDTKMMTFALYCLAFGLIPYAMLSLRIRYLQTIKRLYKAKAMTLIVNFVSVISAALICSYAFGVKGILASNVVSTCLCVFGIIVFTQIKTRKFRPIGEDYLCLPENFHKKNESYFDFDNKQSMTKKNVINLRVETSDDMCRIVRRDNALAHNATNEKYIELYKKSISDEFELKANAYRALECNHLILEIYSK